VTKSLVDSVREGNISDAIPLRAVPRRLPRLRNGKHPHIGTIYRWATVGLRGRKLWTFRVGGTLCTTAEALAAFLDPLNESVFTPPTSPATAPRERANPQVERELDRIGI
jgi:hypothetical protein